MKKLFIFLLAVFCFSSIKAQTVYNYLWFSDQQEQYYKSLDFSIMSPDKLQEMGPMITLEKGGYSLEMVTMNNTTNDFAAGDIITYEFSMNGNVYSSFSDTLQKIMPVDNGLKIYLKSLIPTANLQGGENNMCVKVTAFNGTPVSDEGACVKLILGYNDIAENTLSMAKVYPNPVRNTLTIENVADANISIYSITGQLVQSVPSANGNVQIDMSAMAAGLYIVKMENGKQTRIEKIQVVK